MRFLKYFLCELNVCTNLTLYAVWKLGDSQGPIELISYEGGESGYQFEFTWKNMETCSLDGITIESNAPFGNDYGAGRVTIPFGEMGTHYYIAFNGVNTGEGSLKITLADGSWLSLSYYWGGEGQEWSSFAVNYIKSGN